jgi:hypothetical protein
VAIMRAQQMVDQSVAGIQARMSKALAEGRPQWLFFEQEACVDSLGRGVR